MGKAPEIVRLDTIPSTNAEALRRAREGVSSDAWIVAAEQSGGRGRHGRIWSSPKGGAYATRLLVTEVPLPTLVGLPLVAGLAVHHVVSANIPDVTAQNVVLKWPNDVLVDGEKISGILIETVALTPGKVAVAIGIGQNVLTTPQGTDTPATSYAQLGAKFGVEDVLEATFVQLAAQLSLWDEGRGFAAIRRNWQERGMEIGARTKVRLPKGQIEGTYAGLDTSGGLRLQLDSGKIQNIHTGEIIISRDLR